MESGSLPFRVIPTAKKSSHRIGQAPTGFSRSLSILDIDRTSLSQTHIAATRRCSELIKMKTSRLEDAGIAPQHHIGRL